MLFEPHVSGYHGEKKQMTTRKKELPNRDRLVVIITDTEGRPLPR